MVLFIIRYGLPIAAVAWFAYYLAVNSKKKSEIESEFRKRASKQFQSEDTASKHLHSIIADGYNPAIKKK